MMNQIQITQNREDQELQTFLEAFCSSNAFKNELYDKDFYVKNILSFQSNEVEVGSDNSKNKNNLLFKLKQINISNCQLTQIPCALFDLKYLTVLNLSNNFLESLPEELGFLWNLLALILSGNKLNCLPKSIKHIQQLNYLDLSCNKFSEVPDVLFYGLRFLKILDLSCNEISEFNDILGCFTKLTELRLSNNFIKKLPVWIFDNLCQLKFLDVSQNKLELDTRPIKYYNTGIFESLQTLNVNNCNLRHESIQIISFFKNLKVLYLGNKKDIKTFKSNNFLRNLKIGTFKNLNEIKELYLQSAQVAALPTDFGCFKNIKVLDISDNLLSWLPECICDLVTLEILNLTSNEILYLPVSIGNLVNLKQIHLSNNKLKDIPKSLYTLTTLEYIDLYNNQIEQINGIIFTKKNLKGIDLELNCFQFSFCEISDDINKSKMLYIYLKDSFRKHFCCLNTRFDLQSIIIDKGAEEMNSDAYSHKYSTSSYESEPCSDLEDSFVNVPQQSYHESEDWEVGIGKRDSDSGEDECFDPNNVNIFQEPSHSWSIDFQNNYCPAIYHAPCMMKTYIRNFKLASKIEAVEEGQFDSD